MAELGQEVVCEEIDLTAAGPSQLQIYELEAVGRRIIQDFVASGCSFGRICRRLHVMAPEAPPSVARPQPCVSV
jgi:hypothetical protein